MFFCLFSEIFHLCSYPSIYHIYKNRIMIIIVISKKLAMISKRVEIIKQKTIIYAVIYARVMELVDMLDSKSGDFTVVWVRVPSLVFFKLKNIIIYELPPSPTWTRLIYINMSESFILDSFFDSFFHSV